MNSSNYFWTSSLNIRARSIMAWRFSSSLTVDRVMIDTIRLASLLNDISNMVCCSEHLPTPSSHSTHRPYPRQPHRRPTPQRRDLCPRILGLGRSLSVLLIPQSQECKRSNRKHHIHAQIRLGHLEGPRHLKDSDLFFGSNPILSNESIVHGYGNCQRILQYLGTHAPWRDKSVSNFERLVILLKAAPHHRMLRLTLTATQLPKRAAFC